MNLQNGHEADQITLPFFNPIALSQINRMAIPINLQAIHSDQTKKSLLSSDFF